MWLVNISIKLLTLAGYWWLTLIITAIWEVKIGRMVVGGYLWKIFHKTPSPK
jgi:hypothetical protein